MLTVFLVILFFPTVYAIYSLIFNELSVRAERAKCLPWVILGYLTVPRATLLYTLTLPGEEDIEPIPTLKDIKSYTIIALIPDLYFLSHTIRDICT